MTKISVRISAVWMPLLWVLVWAVLTMQWLVAEEIRENYTPVRSIGMGGASTSVANDDSVLWTNPGGITRTHKARERKGFYLTSLPAITMGANSEAQTAYNIIKSGGFEALSEDTSTKAAQGQASAKPMWGMFSASPAVFFQGGKNKTFGVNLFSVNTFKVSVDPNDPQTSQLSTVSDVGASLGIGFNNLSNRLNAGIVLRPTLRYALEDKVPTEIIAQKAALKKRIQDNANSTSAVAVDVGVLWTLADFWFPSFGLAVLNVPTGCQDGYLNPFAKIRQSVCGTVFKGKIQNPDALSSVDPTDLRVGLSINPRVSRSLSMRLALDVQHNYFTDGTHYYGYSNLSVQKQIHAGMEFFFGNPLLQSPYSFRVGYSQGFISTGVTVSISVLKFEFAAYGQDISSDNTPKEDRRYLLSSTMEL